MRWFSFYQDSLEGSWNVEQIILEYYRQFYCLNRWKVENYTSKFQRLVFCSVFFFLELKNFSFFLEKTYDFAMQKLTARKIHTQNQVEWSQIEGRSRASNMNGGNGGYNLQDILKKHLSMSKTTYKFSLHRRNKFFPLLMIWRKIFL